jgi:hypothetical protein
MAGEGDDYDQGVAMRNLLASIQVGDASSSGTTDCMAQLLAAAVAQFGNGNAPDPNVVSEDPVAVEADPKHHYREGGDVYEVVEDGVIQSTVEVPTTVKRKLQCVKFPVELRKRIIAMRKEGKKSVEVAKALNVSVSGAQKVWERFLATGTVHDRKPSTYAGRPRKSTQNQVIGIM